MVSRVDDQSNRENHLAAISLPHATSIARLHSLRGCDCVADSRVRGGECVDRGRTTCMHTYVKTVSRHNIGLGGDVFDVEPTLGRLHARSRARSTCTSRVCR